jgi:alkanesulfonate monooxygenase SsuD/methylene tetrahydromethanopterin reductase-like flavin-dependent oxidoreductase (luciferase family)
MEPTALALEERGFDSLWVAEHPHIPVTRRFGLPGGMELTKQYYDVMDPFVTLSTAAAVTTRLKLGTGVCLVIQRNTIQTAKLVASLDQVSKGRFLFGIGCGWNAEEMEDHGTVYETRTNGRGGRSRSAILVGDVGRRARGPRCVEAQSRPRHRPHDRAPAASQGGRNPADPRPLCRIART